MEIWQILVLCLLMVPAFLVINYIIVKSGVRKAKERERSIEAAANAVALRNLRNPENRRMKYKRRGR